MSHYEERLDKDLGEIRARVRALSDLAQQALLNALQSLRSGNRKLAYVTILGDARINTQMRSVEALCHRFIVRHLPSAGHLRLMSSVIRISLQLERLGDYAVTIAREGIQLSAPPEGRIADELESIFAGSMGMLTQAIDAFNAADAARAQTVMDAGASIEGTMDGIYADLLAASDPAHIKDLLALFVVFNMIKRVADQAKNVCEETLFAALGKTKPARVHSVLFVDEDNAWLSQMAEAIARRGYPGQAHFYSAGRIASESVDPGLQRFMENHGFDMSDARPKQLDASPAALSQHFVIVSLDGAIERYASQIPFHTSVLEWDVGARPDGLEGDALTQRMEELYREVSAQVRDLVELLTGEETV